MPAGDIIKLTNNQTWTVPAGIYKIRATVVGGGGGGGGGGGSNFSNTGGGGGGGYVTQLDSLVVTPGQQFVVTIGSSGYGGGSGTGGGRGGTTTFGAYSAEGGYGGSGGDASVNKSYGGNGGSGGGAGANAPNGSNAGAGGTNGGPGGSAGDKLRGTGQGTTTIGPDGVYYGAGGGGGGAENYGQTAGAGGNFGGGNGGTGNASGTHSGRPGTPNTGGGGGGGCVAYSDGYGGSGGTGVVVIQLLNNPPNTPTNLTPGSTVSGSPESVNSLTPTFGWTYSDPDGHAQGGYQAVFYKGSDNSVVHDTGQVNSGSSSFKIASGILQPDTVYYWKVSTKDVNNDWSAFSVLEYFKTTKAPIPTQTAPLGTVGAPGGASLTPTLTWDYFDAEAHTQKSFQVRVKNTGGTVVHDSGVVTSANKSYTVPANVLTAGSTYFWEIQVTDSTDMSSGFIGSQYFITSYPPPALIPVRPVHTVRTITKPIFEATIGNDVENDNQHFVIQIADDVAFTTNLQERSTKTAVTGWEIKTSSGNYVAMPASGAPSTYEGGSVKYKWQTDLIEGKTYYWRMAAIDGATNTSGPYHDIRSIRVGNVLQFRAKDPVTTSAPAERIVLTVQSTIANDGTVPASLKVEVSNNALDASPTWEDVTSKVNTGNYHNFTNKAKTAANWAVSYRVTIEANDSLGPIEVQGLGISFD